MCVCVCVCVCSERSVCPTVDIVTRFSFVTVGWDWKMALLTTYTQYSELQVITALLLISTLYRSLLHT
jgi:hypothetical protein